MKTEVKDDYTKVTFDSIAEVVRYNREQERTNKYRYYHSSISVSAERTEFTKTKSYEEAEDMLLHGWDEEAKKLETKLKTIKCNDGTVRKTKTFYNVQGFQASVPRYLQGMPDNMICSRTVTKKQKILNIVKDFTYSCECKASTIEEESVKVLKLVKDLENQGYRINLFISFSIEEQNRYKRRKGLKYISVVIKIKNASQKLNIKQTAFPLVHPSMFRRICFGLIERLDETKDIGYGYGYSINNYEQEHIFKNCYLIPKFLEEETVTDIEKYKVN